MTHDPFAVTEFALDDLPNIEDGLAHRDDFQTAEFGPIWVDWLGGVEPASVFVRNLYEPEHKRRGKHVLGTGLESEELYVVPAASGRDDAERNLALATVIDVNAGMLNEHLMRALPIALDVESRWRKRAEAISQATHFGELAIEGMEGEKALARAADSIFGHSGKTGLRKKRELDMMREIATVRAEHLAYAPKAGIGIDADRVREGVKSGNVRPYPHAADAWFSASKQDQVAQRIVAALRNRAKGDKWGGLRWDVFNLIEGFYRRGLPLSGSAQVALDHALGLIDADGYAREDVPLGGIVPRIAFVTLAREVANGPKDKRLEHVDPADAHRWRHSVSGLFGTAVEALRK